MCLCDQNWLIWRNRTNFISSNNSLFYLYFQFSSSKYKFRFSSCSMFHLSSCTTHQTHHHAISLYKLAILNIFISVWTYLHDSRCSWKFQFFFWASIFPFVIKKFPNLRKSLTKHDILEDD